MLDLCIIVFFFLCEIRCQEYNLFGKPGQAYSIEVCIGHPCQILELLVDTGSSTLPIASYPREKEYDKYFDMDKSSSIIDSGQTVVERYTVGDLSGLLVSDFVKFPSLKNIPEVRTNILLIKESHNFFMNQSRWQGIGGLAYREATDIASGTAGVVPIPWLDAVEQKLNKSMSFQMKLCGPKSSSNTTHYGRFEMLDDDLSSDIHNKMYQTPVLKKSLYNVGMIHVRVKSSRNRPATDHTAREPDADMCQKLNAKRSIVDSGTTTIKLPDELFIQVVNDLKEGFRGSGVSIYDVFWYDGQGICYLVPQKWPMVLLEIDLLSAEADNQYFKLEYPPQSYIRPELRDGLYCYRLGLQRGGKETVLGYSAFEGLKVTFNKSGGWIGFQISDCGPDVRITGPYNVSTSLKITCKLLKSDSEARKIVMWVLIALLIFFICVVILLLARCIVLSVIRSDPRRQHSPLLVPWQNHSTHEFEALSFEA